MKSYMNWSGGKDSALALYEALKNPLFDVDLLLTSFNKEYDRVSMHGVRSALIELQAKSIGLSLESIELPEQPGMKEYEEVMNNKISILKIAGYENSIYGDIFLEDLRRYRENQLFNHGLRCSFPIWGKDSSELLKHFLALGFKTIVVCLNEQYLDKSFCGRVIDENFINDLPANVDPCGEHGEFHTFVFDGPLFKQPIKFIKGELIYRKYTAPKNEDNCFKEPNESELGFFFCDLIPEN